MRTAVLENEGVEVRTEGDSFFVVFPSAVGALRAAVTAQRSMVDQTWPDGGDIRVRIGLHTGEGIVGGDDYIGMEVNRAARIAAAGHGGQVVLSETTRALVASELPDGVSIRDLGPHRLKDFSEAQKLHDLVIALEWLGIGALYVVVLGAPVLLLAWVAWLVVRLVRRRREEALLSS